MKSKSSKHPSTSPDQNEHAFNFVGDVIIQYVTEPGDSCEQIKPFFQLPPTNR